MNIYKDLYRFTGTKSLKKLVFTFVKNPSLRFVVYYRLLNELTRYNPLRVLLRICYEHSKLKYGFQIPINTKIGYGFLIGHFGTIVINSGVVIGCNCNIAQGVVIGTTRRGKKRGEPIIGDNVWIGANAVIVGSIKIGNNALISPLSFVVDDVPENAVVMGNPAKVLSLNGSIGYVNNVL